MKDKGFTLIELLAVIIILGILGAIATSAYHKYVSTTKKKSFEMAEKTFVNNVKDAYADCLSNSTNEFCGKHQSFGYQNEIIYLKELIAYDYSEKIKNPYDTNTYCNEELSYVKVVGSGDVGINKTATYTVCLVCGDVQSTSCSN